jgi:NitT/TauT family transport system permease protein
MTEEPMTEEPTTEPLPENADPRSVRKFQALPPALRRRPGLVLSPLFLLFLVALWYAASHELGVPGFILPPPEQVLWALRDGLSKAPNDPSGFWYHIGVTGAEALIGFLLGSGIGIVFGVCVARWKLVEETIYPYIVAFQAMPKVALAPLVIIWFGFDMFGKIVITSIITFFPVLVNTMLGYWSVDRDRIDFAKTCNATDLQILWKIILPSALPAIFAGLNVASVLALLGALVGEFVGAQAGLGMLLMQYNQSMQMGPVFALLIILALLGYLASATIRMFEYRFCGWARRNIRLTAE